MIESDAAENELHSRVVRITPAKLLGLAVAGLLVPLHFVMGSERFRPGEWGSIFWVVGGLLWLVGVLAAFVLYFGATHVLAKYRGTKS